jgi:hypothetical protein
MRMPMKARHRVSRFTMLAAGGLFLSACAGEATAPSSAAPRTQMRVSSFAPSGSAKALFGVSDGVYTITVDPTVAQSFNLGANHIEFPANSICELATSSYGSSHWNEPCAAETLPVTITVTIREAKADRPRIDFQPAMRFSPDKNVQLFMYSPSANVDDSWKMLYCDALNKCADESLTDPDLQSYVDHDKSVVFRRIKHFSGYLIWSLNPMDLLAAAL